MHDIRRYSRLWLLPIASIGLGCASTGGYPRSAEDSKVRTIASIGDRPLPSATGGTDSSVAANLDGTDRARTGRDIVSGRVVDDRGDPVPDARVRVADGGISGGRVIQAKTDRAGGFTLHGLRPGSTYTLIAEYEGADGLVEGRTEAKSPRTGVEIAVQVDDQPIDRRRAAKPSSSRVISDRQPIDEQDEGDRPLRLNNEDTPASGDVEDVDDLAGKTSMRPRDEATPASGWRATGMKRASKSSAVASSADGDKAARRASTRVVADSVEEPASRSVTDRGETPPAAADDEDENPLPPAIERDEGQTRGARAEPDRGEPPGRPATSKRISKVRTNGPGQTPGALVLAKDQIPTPLEEQPARPSPAAEAEAASFTDPFAESAPKPTTFGDLAKTWKSMPKSEPIEEPHPRLGLGRLVSKTPKPAPSIEACRYDRRKRQLIDFRLPDLEGRAVTLKDFDGELIVLDFWGTWCKPCLSSVPHLVDLQKRLGDKRLTIVGIACEEGPTSANGAHVAEVVERLGINYPVLLSSVNEPSPLLEALNIQTFPTLIVLDREGRIVWRDQGATETTLARLDRAVDPTVRR